MLGRARTVAVIGLDAVGVTVESHVGPGLPGLSVIGSSGAAAREAADRVRTALRALGVTWPNQKVLVSLAPAEVPKVGARFDLAMAVAVLASLGEVGGDDRVGGTALLGELALDGALRPVPGVLPSAAALPAAGIARLLVPDGNAAEARLVDGVDVVPVADLAEAVGILRGERSPRPVPSQPASRDAPPADLAEVRGQQEARRALEVAAAGGHHLLLLGPPGCGKSMLVRRLPGILPPLGQGEALEVAAVRSVAGLLAGPRGGGAVLDRTPPLRAPHHGVSAAALLGGGSGVARPGELSLAHHGVLLLDELFEWPRHVLESLREPLDEGVVRIARSRATVTYPARVLLAAAANPCPCGGAAQCLCPDETVWAYRAKLSGPLADRLDLAPSLAPLVADDLLSDTSGEPTAVVAARVAAARAAGAARWDAMDARGGRPPPNALAPPEAVRRVTRPAALRRLAVAVERGELTGRGHDRVLRVARTCADLDGADLVGVEHVLEAHTHRLGLATAVSAGREGRQPARAGR